MNKKGSPYFGFIIDDLMQLSNSIVVTRNALDTASTACINKSRVKFSKNKG
jgi:hypothetical protein